MTEATDRIGQLSPLKRALLALEELQAKVDALEHGQREAIAIIGLGCRYPGVKSPQEFWKLLENGVDAIQEVPKERWDWEAYYDPDPEAAGKMYTRWGGFIDGIDQFDPAFFSISPREAANMDPQQRLLLEVAWEALEHAGQRAGELTGSPTGVFVGISSNDFASLFKSGGTIEQVNPYIGTGTAFSVAAGRLSYSLGLQGPCISIDTACSSSLVAVHLAAQSLRSGECRLAIAGGVNAILSPEGTIYFSRLRAMAHDGRCKTFDASADGYVRSEGCGVVVLKRLSDALADGDRVLAVILGSAINQDGRSNGLTAPNPLAQQAVVQSALTAAGISPELISFVETHGTGTELGDPIEVRALGAVFGDRRLQGGEPGAPVYLGAVKANFGHSEAAAGVAGLIKLVLSMQHAQIPAQLHVKELNPLVDWAQYPFVIPNETIPWPAIDGKRIAGLSSFGFSGTNAHIILADPGSVLSTASVETTDLARAAELLTEPPAVLLPISARTPQALHELAAAYQKFLTEPVAGEAPADLADVAYTASYRTSHHPHRLAVVAQNNQAAAGLLDAFLQDEKRSYLAVGEASRASLSETPKIVFVFPGQGSQWVGMGRALLQQEPVFKRSIERCDQAIQKFAGWSLIEKLTSDQAADSLSSEIDVIQPALFAMQFSLAELWMSWGIRPQAVVGHSLGEVAAAAIAGVLSLEEAAHIICLRSQLMRRVSGQGAMAVVGISLDEAEALLKPVEDLVSVGVSNGPRSTVISGDPATIDQIVGDLDRQGVFARRVKVDVASHSVQMEPLRAELVSGLSGLQPQTGLIPVYSTVLSRMVDGSELTEQYWGYNLRNPVRFWSVVQQLARQGKDVFLEVSPHPVLVTAIRDGLKEIGHSGLALPSARKQESERAVMLETVGALYAAGYSITGLLPQSQHNRRRQVELPAYPWDHQRYWIQDGRGEAVSIRYASPNGHPLLGIHLSSASQPGVQLWETELSVNQAPYLKDHRVLGTVMLPAAAYLDAALTATRQALGQGDDREAAGIFEIEQAIFHQALVLSEERAKELQLVISETAGDLAGGQTGVRFQLFSRLDSEHPGQRERWNLHASGICRLGGRSIENTLTLEGLRQRFVESGSEQLPVEPYYEALRQAGLEYGPYFQGIQEIWARPAEALAHIHPAAQHQPLLMNKQYSIHPALLDAAFQALGAAVTSRYQTEQQAISQLPGEMQALATQKPLPTWVPVAVERMRLLRRPESTDLWSHAVLLDPGASVGNPSLASSPTTLKGDVTLWDAGGQVIAEVYGLQLQQLAPSTISQPTPDQPAAIERWFYRTTWQPAALLPEPAAIGEARPALRKRWLILGDTDENAWQKSLVAGLVEKLAVAQAQCIYATCPEDAGDLLRVLQQAGGLDGLDGIVSLVGLSENQPESLSLAELEDYQAATLGRLLHLIQSVSQLDSKTTPRLYLVTRNAQKTGFGSASETSTALGAASSSIWGLGRTIIHEQSDLNCCLVDLSLADGSDFQAELSLLADEFLYNPGGSAAENQIALRGDRRYVARLERYNPGEAETGNQLGLSSVQFNPVKDQNYRLTTRSQSRRTGDSYPATQSSTSGDLDSLALQVAPRVSPGPGQIEILVQAAGLNFLDVLTALGLRPDLPPGPIQFGTECAGRVV
ncbi:MAG: acyltransferase domain-containing protein, partial [Anaerolineales bacterium]|nr:acyltransferase domain-containing protein [Anaerolineales bacterium]